MKRLARATRWGAWLVLLVALGFPLAACETDHVSHAVSLEVRADSVVELLHAEQWQRLSEMVHADRGVTFSAYAYVDPDELVTLRREQVEAIGADSTVYLWGVEDGSGFEIRMTPTAFVNRWITDRDFTAAQRGNRDEVLETGNSLNNLPHAFYDQPPSASEEEITFIEYHLTGSSQYNGMDWASLRLVFERESDGWFLIGIVRDRWTI